MSKTEESFNCLVCADPAAGGGQEELRRQEGLDGLASVPGSFFVEPSSPHRSHPTRAAILKYGMGVNNGSVGSFREVPGF